MNDPECFDFGWQMLRPYKIAPQLRISRWYYLQALANEISGDSKLSAEIYYHIWERFSQKPLCNHVKSETAACTIIKEQITAASSGRWFFLHE
jgi:hypothetical protein